MGQQGFKWIGNGSVEVQVRACMFCIGDRCAGDATSTCGTAAGTAASGGDRMRASGAK